MEKLATNAGSARNVPFCDASLRGLAAVFPNNLGITGTHKIVDRLDLGFRERLPVSRYGNKRIGRAFTVKQKIVRLALARRGRDTQMMPDLTACQIKCSSPAVRQHQPGRISTLRRAFVITGFKWIRNVPLSSDFLKARPRILQGNHLNER